MTQPAPGSPPFVPTPCIGVCRLDEASGCCLGCARTGDEIGIWAEAGCDYKRSVWHALPPRRVQLGLSVYRLPWTPRQIGAFAESSLRQRTGCWRFGVEGAAIRFAPCPDDWLSVTSNAEAVTAIGERGAVRLLKHEKTIAFAFGRADDPQGPEAIGLLLPKGRVKLRVEDGPDTDALVPLCRSMRLRTVMADADLGFILAVRSGHELVPETDLNGASAHPEQLAVAERMFAEGHAHAVVETGLGRAEVFRVAPGASEIDLDAHRLSTRKALPSGWQIDRVFALGALFFPRPHRPLPQLESEHF